MLNKRVLILLSCLGMLFLLHPAFIQGQPKPQYLIETKRSGTSIGKISIELFPLIAPQAVQYFDSLVAIRFFDSCAFHRVMPKFMIQGGDPNSRSGDRSTWGYGNPNQKTVRAEFSKIPFARGILGAARDNDINSATSQFFICVAPANHLNGQYTVYGKVVSGMNIADTIVSSTRDIKDNPLDKIEMFITKIGVNDSIPMTPSLLLPKQNEQGIGSSTNLTWEPVNGALLYNVEVAEDSAFSTMMYSDVIATTATTIGGIKPGLNTYYWRVKSNNGGFYSLYSPTRAFTSVMATPELILPDSAATIQDTTVRLQWSSVKGASSYHVQVGTSVLYTSSTIVLDKKNYSDTSLIVSGLLKNKKYYWRVSAANSDYETQATASRFFNTQFINSVHNSSLGFGGIFFIQPNPVTTQATIQLTTRQECSAQFIVVDVNGKIVHQWNATIDTSTVNAQTLDCSWLCNGVYLLRAAFSTGELKEQMFVIER